MSCGTEAGVSPEPLLVAMAIDRRLRQESPCTFAVDGEGGPERYEGSLKVEKTVVRRLRDRDTEEEVKMLRFSVITRIRNEKLRGTEHQEHQTGHVWTCPEEGQ